MKYFVAIDINSNINNYNPHFWVLYYFLDLWTDTIVIESGTGPNKHAGEKNSTE